MEEYREFVRNSKDFNEDTALTLNRSALQNEIIEAVVPMFFRSEKKINTWIYNMKCTMIISKEFSTMEKAQVLVEKINAVNDDKIFRPAFASQNRKGKFVVSFGASKLKMFY